MRENKIQGIPSEEEIANLRNEVEKLKAERDEAREKQSEPSSDVPRCSHCRGIHKPDEPCISNSDLVARIAVDAVEHLARQRDSALAELSSLRSDNDSLRRRVEELEKELSRFTSMPDPLRERTTK